MYWHNQKAGRNHYLRIGNRKVTIWENYNDNPHTEVGREVFFEDFIAGEGHALVLQHFHQDILKRILHIIKSELQ